MKQASIFSWNHYFHGIEEMLLKYGIDPHSGLNLLFVAFLLVALAFFAGRKYRSVELVEPSAKITFSSLIAMAIEYLYDQCRVDIGSLTKKVFWLIGGFFIFILWCNILGLIPGFTPPTEKFSVTFSLGMISFLLYNYIGIKKHQFGYLRHFLGPVLYLAPLIGLIELISHLVRPLTLGLRLFGNITGDHFVMNIFTENIFPVIVPIPFMVLGLFIALVQAYVFFRLSLLYVSSATEDAH